MKIPLEATPAPDTGTRTFAPVDTGIPRQVGQATERLGGAIADVGTQLPMQIRQAQDVGTLSKMETQRDTSLQAFVQSLSDGKNPKNDDPDSFMQRWQDWQKRDSDKWMNDPGVKSLSLAARNQYQVESAKWGLSAASQVNAVATQKRIANARGNIDTSYEAQLLQYGQNGTDPKTGEDIAGSRARQTVEDGIRTGVYSPEEGASKIYNIPIKGEYNQAVRIMSGDPYGGQGPMVLEKMLRAQTTTKNADGTISTSYDNFKHVVGTDRESLVRYAMMNGRMLQSQTAEGYAMQRAQGQPISQDQAKTDLNAGLLTPSEFKALTAPVKQYSPQAFAQIMTDIDKADLQHDDDYSKRAAILGEINTAQEYMTGEANKQLIEALHDKLSPTGTRNNPAVSAILDRSKEMFTSGGFGKFDSFREPSKDELRQDPTLTKVKVRNIDTYNDALMNMAHVNSVVTDYAKNHSDASEEELMGVYVNAVKPMIAKTGMNLMDDPVVVPSAPNP